MTPEERDRLRTIEVRMEILEKDFQEMLKKVQENFFETNKKLDNIAQLVSAGRGAWKAIAVMATVLAVIGSFVAWVFSSWDKIRMHF